MQFKFARHLQLLVTFKTNKQRKAGTFYSGSIAMPATFHFRSNISRVKLENDAPTIQEQISCSNTVFMYVHKLLLILFEPQIF